MIFHEELKRKINERYILRYFMQAASMMCQRSQKTLAPPSVKIDYRVALHLVD
jgi:hypothetical protein